MRDRRRRSCSSPRRRRRRSRRRASRATIARVAAVQSCPVLISEPATAPWIAASRSASSNTTNGALPPSSSWVRWPCTAAAAITLRPTGVDPVNVTTSTSRWPASAVPTSPPAPVTTLKHAVGQARLGGQPRQGQRGQRRQLGGFDDDAAAGGQRGQHLPHRHLQRVVPRRDGRDDPDGLAPDARGVVAGVLGGGLALEVAGRAGEEVDVVDAAGHVELAGQPRRLAGLADLLGDQLVGVARTQRRQLGQHRRPVHRGRAGPAPAAPSRAEATAVSTSAGVANASSATTSPFAGLMT